MRYSQVRTVFTNTVRSITYYTQILRVVLLRRHWDRYLTIFVLSTNTNADASLVAYQLAPSQWVFSLANGTSSYQLFLMPTNCPSQWVLLVRRSDDSQGTRFFETSCSGGLLLPRTLASSPTNLLQINGLASSFPLL